MKTLKLIWDFRGPAAENTARHHEIHLKEYAIAENLEYKITGVETINDMHTLAFLVVSETNMPQVRNALKPHRGQVYNA